MNKTARFSAAAIVAFGLVTAAYFGAGDVRKAPMTTVAAMAPNTAFTLLNGSRSDIASLRGKVVLVNFWATDCTTCVHEMPQIVATHQKFKARGFETLAVAMSYDPPASVISFAETRQLPFGVVIDNTGAIARSFDQVRVTPTTVLINKRGEIVKRFVGEPDFAALHQLVEKLLTET